MTAYLADTHIVVWALDGSPKLSRRHQRILRSDATVFVSMATLWEMTIKASLGKLTIPAPIAENVIRAGFELLGIERIHIDALATLPHHHRDPFDRMLIAQAQTSSLRLLSNDRAFTQYDVDLA